MLWKDFSPAADVEILRLAPWGKQSTVNVRVEQINPNEVPARAAAAIETQEGPDILEFFHNWRTQHANEGVGVTRGRETGGRTCTGYPS